MARLKKVICTESITRLCIWSVRNQSWLAGQVRIYIVMATAIIAFLALAGVITLQTAMMSSFCFGAIAMGMIWALIQHRRAWLLNIKEPEMRRQALAAMQDYIREAQGFDKAPREKYTAWRESSEQCVDCRAP